MEGEDLLQGPLLPEPFCGRQDILQMKTDLHAVKLT
jgi:hypothetical protein